MIVSEQQQPPTPDYVSEWERGLDPWHADAFPAEFKHAGTGGDRRAGWFALDWFGNAIGFIPDGTEYPEHKEQK